VPVIADLLATSPWLGVPDEVHVPTQVALCDFLKRHFKSDAIVPERTTRQVVQRMCKFTGVPCWTLAEPSPVDGMSDVEERAVRQLHYDTMPATCVDKIMDAIKITLPTTSSQVRSS
jgi:hypothetical protein